MATQILRSKVVDSVACMHKAYVCPMSFDLMKVERERESSLMSLGQQCSLISLV